MFNSLRRKKQIEGLDKHGHEIPDPTPMEPPIGYVKQPSLAEQIRDAIRSHELKKEAEAAGFETFEEAEDFDVGDDYEPTSPFEETFEPLHPAPATPVVELAETKAVEAASPPAEGSEPPDSGDPVAVPPKAAKRPSK